MVIGTNVTCRILGIWKWSRMHYSAPKLCTVLCNGACSNWHRKQLLTTDSINHFIHQLLKRTTEDSFIHLCGSPSIVQLLKGFSPYSEQTAASKIIMNVLMQQITNQSMFLHRALLGPAQLSSETVLHIHYEFLHQQEEPGSCWATKHFW